MVGWWVANEMEKCNGYNALIRSNITRLSSTVWLRTISTMDRSPADCRTEQYQSEVEKRYGLNRSGRLHILNWSGFWRFLYFRSSLGELRHGKIFYRRFTTIWWFAIVTTLYTTSQSYFRISERFEYLFTKCGFLCTVNHILPDLLI